MSRSVFQPRASTVEQVLVLDRSPCLTDALALELNRRGVVVATVADLAAGVLLSRTIPYRAIIFGPGLDAALVEMATAVVRAIAIGSPTLLLLAADGQAQILGRALLHADELMSADLPPARIVDALGIAAAPVGLPEWLPEAAAA
jgi:hypothetical protein